MKNFASLLFSKIGLIIFALVLLAVGALYWKSQGSKPNEVQVHQLAVDEIIIVRTPGGLIEVATLIKNEDFSWSTEHTCKFFDCSVVGRTVSNLRVPVHYTYRIPLAASWTLKLRDGYYELKVPGFEPKLPVAIDLTKAELSTKGGMFSPNKAAHRESMMKHLVPEFNKRATQKSYLDSQRDTARKTVGEFARKWMVKDGVDAKKADLPIKVFFADEGS